MKYEEILMKKIEMSAFWRRPQARNDIQVISVIISADIIAGYRPRCVFNKLRGIKSGCG